MPIAYTHDAYTTLHSHSVDITGHPTFLVRNATLAAHLALVVAAGGNGWALGRLIVVIVVIENRSRTRAGAPSALFRTVSDTLPIQCAPSTIGMGCGPRTEFDNDRCEGGGLCGRGG